MRWIVRIIGALIIVVIGAVAVLFLLPADRIAKLVSDRFEATTGRAMTLGGDVRPTLWPELGVRTGPVTIANADWSEGGPMLQAEALSIGVDWRSIFGDAIRVTRVEADSPQVLLELARDGQANWDLPMGASADGAATTAATEGGGTAGFALDKAVIRNASVTYVDHGTGSRTRVDAIDATIRLPDFKGAAELELAGAMNGQPLSLTGTIFGFSGFLADGAVPVSLKSQIGGSRVGFDGRAGLQPFALGGQLDADLSDMSAVYALIGQAAPDVPRGLGRQIAITGAMTVTDAGGVTLRDGTIRLDHNVFSGAVDLVLADRPRVTARLSAGALDFSALTADAPQGGAAEGAAAPGAGWSRDKIDVSAMGLVDANIVLAAASIDLGLAQFDRTALSTDLDMGRAVTQIRELAAYGGAMTGSFVINSRGGLSARANLAGDGVALEPLLKQLAGYDRLLAAGDVTINLLGVGDDMYTLMNSLDGDGTLRLGKGELRGLDLVGMLRNFDTSFIGEGAKTIFDSVEGSFSVENGVMSNVDLKLTSPLLTATGSGKIGIGGQTLDYRVVPRLLESQTGGGIAIPLMITGTWADPKFRLDLEALAEQELGDEIEEVKDKVEEAVVDKINEELGVNVESLGNVEDEVKQELEERAVKGILDLLGGN